MFFQTFFLPYFIFLSPNGMLSNHIAFLQIILVFRGSVLLPFGEVCASGVISAELEDVL